MPAPEIPDFERTPSPRLPPGSPVVALLTPWVPQYRTGLYTLMRDQLADAGVELRLVHGDPFGDAAKKGDCVTLPWAHFRDSKVLPFGPRGLSWQPVLDVTRDADLVIHDQQISRLVVPFFGIRQIFGRQRFAFFGHGRNLMVADRSGVGEAAKVFLSRRVHWWFPYNDRSAQIVAEMGYPRERMSPVNNAIDTTRLRADLDAVTEEQVVAARARHGIEGHHVGIYIGGMYLQKRLDVLVEAAEAIRRDVPDFEMVFVGGGPGRDVVTRAAETRRWLHDLGPRFGAEKAELLTMADAILMPGVVGLVVLDAFVAETPLVTIDNPEHGPEIGYLVDGRNGVMLPEGTDTAGYAAAVVDLLGDRAARDRLREGAREAAGTFTIEHMAQRWSDGILDALAADDL